jgi:predicted DNA-binding protein
VEEYKMSNSAAMSLRLPVDLKERLKRQAKKQGVSLNQLVNYFINFELTSLEVSEKLNSPKQIMTQQEARSEMSRVLKKVHSKAVPEWDQL